MHSIDNVGMLIDAHDRSDRGKVEEEMHSSQTFQAQQQGRRKVGGMGGVRTWMVVSETGESGVEEVEKHSIMQRTGLPARDLRVLDPMLSNSSSILGRDRAIVVSLEHIKAIITANQVLIMIASSDPLFTRFLQDLQTRIPSSTNRTPQRMSNDTDNCYEVNPQLGGTGSPSLRSHSSDYDRKNSSMRMFDDSDAFPAGTSDIETKWGDSNKSAKDWPVAPPPKQFPFEFRALEACLDSACRCLESETQTLEEEAYPALDELTSQISTLNLERVRQIKSRLVALSGRVQKVRDQLENLLDDDNDMAEMYLTHKLDARLNMDQALSLREGFNPKFEEDDEDERDESYSKKSGSLSDPKLDVEELEMLLEAYFAQISGISQKLSSLSEYVDDTEDCINISLDDKRNQLLQVAVAIDTLTMILNAGIVVVALFGMNIHIELFDGQPDHQFWATAAGTFGGCMALFLVSVWWGKKRYLFSA